MANIKVYLDNILKAILGKDVRQSIHDGIEAINNDVLESVSISKNTETRQNLLEQKYDEQIRNIAASEPQNAEIVDARGGFDTLGLVIQQKTYHFANIEAMKKCLTLIPGDVVQTLGYYSENDGGQGLYRIVNDSSLVDDGGSVHDLANGLKAKLIIKNSLNIKQFGARGNNEQDDTKFIQDAVNFLRNNINTIKQWSLYDIALYFPAGQYKITEPVIFSPFLRYRTDELVSFMNYSTTNCIILKNKSDDMGYNTTHPYRNFCQGKIFGGLGSFQIIDFSESRTSIGLELGVTVDEYNNLVESTKPYKALSMTNFENVTVYNFDIGIKINSINFYIADFSKFRAIACRIGIFVTGDSINSGENISFTNSSISSCEYGIINTASAFNISFNNCSFDFNHIRIAQLIGTSILNFTNCHIEHNENQEITENYGLISCENITGINSINFINCYIYSQDTQLLPLVTGERAEVTIINCNDAVASNCSNLNEIFNTYLINSKVINASGNRSTYRRIAQNLNKNIDGDFETESVGTSPDLKNYSFNSLNNVESYEIIEESGKKALKVVGNSSSANEYFNFTLETKNFIELFNKQEPIRANSNFQINDGIVKANIVTKFYDYDKNLIESKTAYATEINETSKYVKNAQCVGSGIPANAVYCKVMWTYQVFTRGTEILITNLTAY